jgi:hypothetical protein
LKLNHCKKQKRIKERENKTKARQAFRDVLAALYRVGSENSPYFFPG